MGRTAAADTLRKKVATLSEAAAEASVAAGVSEPRRADDQRASTDSSSLISSEPLTREEAASLNCRSRASSNARWSGIKLSHG